jgi:hypothetical protein
MLMDGNGFNLLDCEGRSGKSPSCKLNSDEPFFWPLAIWAWMNLNRKFSVSFCAFCGEPLCSDPTINLNDLRWILNQVAHGASKTNNALISNCARPPHPKGMGYASGRALRLAGFQKHLNLRLPRYDHQNNCISAFDFMMALPIYLKKI